MTEIKILLSWKAHEYPYYPKTTRWYTILGIATIAFMIIAYLLDNFLFGIFIIIASFTVAMYGSKKPQVVEFQLTAQGIK